VLSLSFGPNLPQYTTARVAIQSEKPKTRYGPKAFFSPFFLLLLSKGLKHAVGDGLIPLQVGNWYGYCILVSDFVKVKTAACNRSIREEMNDLSK